MYANTSTLVLNEGSDSPLAVTVRELTVREIREWLAEVKADGQLGLIDALLLKDLTLPDLVRVSSLTMEQLDKIGPSKLRQVVDVAKEINSAWFDLRERILDIGRPTLSPAKAEPAA
ncbi:hypothetical protein [Zoogloea sp.]|uniref:hypothetical protein n=1 Tax=Zoogloea sp. TaxID=49181 RepID=UPI0035AE16B0